MPWANGTTRNEIIIAVSALGLLVLLFVWNHYRTSSPQFAAPTSNSVPLVLKQNELMIRLEMCDGDVSVLAITDTGSGNTVVANEEACVRVQKTAPLVYASEKVDAKITVNPIPYSLNGQIQLNSRVRFTPSGFSVFGLWPSNDAQLSSFEISYDGHSGGYLTTPAPPRPSDSITLSYESGPANRYFYVLNVNVSQPGEKEKPMKMIVDSGSTDMFVSPNTLKKDKAITVKSPQGGVLASDVKDVIVTPGGKQFVAMLDKMNAFIGGLPLFAGRRVIFDQRSQTISFAKL